MRNRIATLLAALILVSAGCSKPMMGPTEVPKAAVRTIGYDINIPDVRVVNTLKGYYPGGFEGPPLEAQARWNYTEAYKGTPNVYYGDIAPKCEYHFTGIVVAPFRVAGMQQFTSKDWPGPLEPGIVYSWLGRFTYTAIADPSTYVIDPKATCS